MNKKKMTKVIVAITICTIMGISGQRIYAYDNASSTTLIPTSEKIKQKTHFKQLKKIASNSGSPGANLLSSTVTPNEINTKINNYLDTLDTNTLVLTIAETADEADKAKDYTELNMFANASQKKLVPNLSTNDYIKLLDSDQVSQSFKTFMIDTAVHSQKNDKTFNNKLRQIIKKDNNNNKVESYSTSNSLTGSTDQLVNFSLQSINDYTSNDVPMLKSILNSNKYNSIAKSTAIYKLSDVDKKTTSNYLTNILKNKNKYCNEEISASMFVLSNYFKTTTDKEEYKNLLIKNAKDILSNKQSSDLIDATVFSLGETKDKDAINLIANNVDTIKDDSLISYFVDMNFSTINEMLDNNSSKDDINSALTLAGISKYDDFLTNLEKLKNNSDKKIAEKSQSILNELNKTKDNPIKRNPKWDNFK